MAKTGVCAKCDKHIAVTSAECPLCGYNPQSVARIQGLGLIALGGILTVFIVTAIIGIPMLLYGLYKIYTARELTPVDS